MPINIVFLFDLNSFPPGNDLEVQHKYLKWVQEQILTLVSKAATDESSNEQDYSKIMWSFKFYNSAKDVDFRNKKFEPFTIASFEAFESAILQEYDKFRSCQANQDCSDVNRSSCLSQALMRVTSDLRWEEIPGRPKNPENIVYAILRVPRDDDELFQFTDSNEDLPSSPNSKHVLHALLPKAFLTAFHQKYRIQLNFIDTWVLQKHENLEKNWNGQDYCKQIIKVLDYLNKGTVLQIQKPQQAPPGLPSYFTLLKNTLRQATSTSPTTFEKLSAAQKLLQSNRSVCDSSKLDSSFSSVPGGKVKPRDKRRKVEHKENRGRVSGSRYKKAYPGLKHVGFEKGDDFDSSTSEDMGSAVFGNGQEQALNKYIQTLARKDPQRYRQGKTPKPSSRHLHPPTSAPQSRQRRSPPLSGRDSELSILSGTNLFSRTAQLLNKATQKEWKKWTTAISKEEEERRIVRDERRKFLARLELSLTTMKDRLDNYLEKCNLQDVMDMEQLLPALKEFQEQCLADESVCLLSLSQTIVQFLMRKLQASKVYGEPAREFIEKSLYVPIPELRAQVLKAKSDDGELAGIFRHCQLQILIRMEASWLVPDPSDNVDTLRDEIVDLLSLLAIYMKKPVDDFLANILVQGYMETHSEMLIRLYRGLNTDAPRNLILCVTPSKSIRSRGSLPPSAVKSSFGSTESLFQPPSQVKSKPKLKDLIRREESFASQKSSARHASAVYVNNPKKVIMVPVRNVKKFSTVPKSPKPAPRSSRVRRNLFDSDGSKRKVSSRSPTLPGKPHGTLLSPRVKSLRSKRKLNLDDEDEGGRHRRHMNIGGSPDLFSPSRDDPDRVLCPATPSDKSQNSCKRLKRSSSLKSTSDRVIEESPELPKSGFSRSFSQAVHSLSFYSTGSDSFRSRAWEKSGNKMMAAKIKRTIDSSSFMNSGLTLSDLEIIGGASSPESKSVDNFQSPLPKSKKMLPDQDAIPCCSKSIQPPLNNVEVEVVHANVNPNIEALIRSDQSLSLLKTTPKANVAAAGTPKKISFNFDERLIKTPSRNSPGTPKGILKTPNRDSVKKPDGSQDDQATPVKPTHFQLALDSPPKIPMEKSSKPQEPLPDEGLAPLEPQAIESSSNVELETYPSQAESTVSSGGAHSVVDPVVGRIAGMDRKNSDSQGSFLDMLNFPNNPEYDQQILQSGSNFEPGYPPAVSYDTYFTNYCFYQSDFGDPLSFPQYGHAPGNSPSSKTSHLHPDSSQPSVSGLTDL